MLGIAIRAIYLPPRRPSSELFRIRRSGKEREIAGRLKKIRARQEREFFMREQEVHGRVHGSSTHEYDRSFVAATTTQTERLLRAVLCLVGCWTLAVPLVFVPVVHFFLVPPLLLAGPLLGFWELRNKGLILPTEVSCPDCHKATKLTKRRIRDAFYSACDSCGQNICYEIFAS